jgi:ribonuclease Z
MLRLCAILLTFVAVSFTAEAARSDAKLFRVTLLGTGSPDPVVNRFSASTLVEAGEQKLLFDAGRGVTIRLWQCQVPLSRIDVVFFTHYHSDHTIGLPDLLLTGWLPSSFGHRVAPLHVVGPVGAKKSSIQPRRGVRSRHQRARGGAAPPSGGRRQQSG